MFNREATVNEGMRGKGMAIDLTAIIVDHIVGYILDQSGVGEVIRGILRRDPQQRAFKRALMHAFGQFKQQHPEAAASLFDLHFFSKEGGPIIEQFLIRDGKPDPSQLALRWAKLLNIRQSERTVRVRELEHIAANFLNILNHSLKAEPDLKEINDSRVLEQTANSAMTLSVSFDAFLTAFLGKLNDNKFTSGTLHDYLHWLIERNLYLDPRGILQTQRSVQVKLEEIYISLRAQREETPGSVDRRLLGQELAELEANLTSSNLPTEEQEDLREHLLARYSNQLLSLTKNESETLELAEVVTRHDKLVILGDPGSGKTTLLRYLALQHAQAIQAGLIEVSSDLGSARFPILVRIADYAEYGLPKGKSLSDFLVDYFSMHECPGDGLADLLMTKLEEGNCFLLLDGLDEIVSADERRTVVHQVEEFIRRHDDKGNHFIITSRVAGYRSAPLGEPFAHYIVQEMDETQIRRFLERWCIAVEIAQTPQLTVETHESTARRELEGIIKAVHNSQGVHRLAANPLLLRILALIHRTGAQLPQKRIELYRITADTLARTWRMAQGISESALIKDEYLTPLLSKLAYWLHTNKPTGIATEREVYDILGEEWASLHDIEWDSEKPNLKIKEDVRTFLLAVREHTGLFVERAPRRYGFMHQTFEEYYAARYLVARSKMRARLIREHLHDSHWNEPILLALGFVGMESSIESNDLLETAILARGRDAQFFGFTPSLYEDHLSRDYLFALRCLGDGIPIRPPSIRRLLKRLADELLHLTGSARFWRYRQALYERLEHLSLSESATTLSQLLLDASKIADVEVRRRAAESLKKLGQKLPDELNSLSSMEQGVVNLARTVFTNSNQDADSLIPQLLSLGKSGQASTEETAILLRTIHKSSDPATRQAAVWSLGRLTPLPSEGINALLVALQDADAGIRYTAARSLHGESLTSPNVLKALLNTLKDTDFRVRQEVIGTLAQLGQANSEVILALQNMMYQDAEAAVCYTAALNLGRIGQVSPEVITISLQALQNAKSWSLRRDIALFLSEIDQADEAIIEALWQGLLDDDNEVRASCVESLAQLGRRFPSIATVIGGKFVQALEDPRFDKPDNIKKRSAHEYAFNGLWLMVVSGEVVAEEY